MLDLATAAVIGFVLLDAPRTGPTGLSRRTRWPCAADDAIDVDSQDDSFEACMAMKVSELKAELDLRKIGYEGCFEKEEFARRLSDARVAGRADSSLLDDVRESSQP